MFLPIGDSPRLENFNPWVNWALIAVNVLIYVFVSLPLSFQPVDPSDPSLEAYLKFLIPQLPPIARPPNVPMSDILSSLDAYTLYVFEHGYKSAAPEILDLFAGLFLHGGFAHLAGNMLFLWIYGDNVEHRLGRLGYLFAYLLTGVIATKTYAWVSGPSMTPLVGASGAISGVLGLYFVLFPRNQVKILIAFFPIYVNIVPVPARFVLTIYVVIDNLLPQLMSSGSNVAYGAHLGGFVGGFAWAFLGERYGWRLPWEGRAFQKTQAQTRRTTRPPPSAIDSLKSALQRGDVAALFAALPFVGEPELIRLHGVEIVELARVLAQAGHGATALRVLRRYLVANPTGPDAARVYLALALERLKSGQPTAAYQHLQSALDAGPDPRTDAEIREALRAIPIFRRPS